MHLFDMARVMDASDDPQMMATTDHPKYDHVQIPLTDYIIHENEHILVGRWFGYQPPSYLLVHVKGL